MADKDLIFPDKLPADLPTDWEKDQIVPHNGEDDNKPEQYGFNYLMKQVNDAQRACNMLGAISSTLTAEQTALITSVGTDIEKHNKIATSHPDIRTLLDSYKENIVIIEQTKASKEYVDNVVTMTIRIKITFAPGFEGKEFTVVAGDYPVHSGTVPEERIASVPVSMLNTTYTITCNGISGYVTTGNSFGIYSTPFPTMLANFEWAQIAEISAAGKGSIFFQIGDEKPIISSTGEPVTARLEDFWHENLVTGGKAGMTFAFKNLLKDKYKMNSTNTNAGGYKPSLMRSTHIPEIFATLPADLRAAIKPVIKKSMAGGQSTTIQTTEESLWPFSAVEVGLLTTNAGYKDEGETYPLFVDNASRIKYLSDGAGAANNYWTRSPYVGASISFISVRPSGTSADDGASISYGACLSFCV